MMKLIQFPSLWGLPNGSPFCMKVETYLRMTKLPYKIEVHADPRGAPKGKFPYLVDEGKVICDSSAIIEYLKQKYGDTLDANLTPMQKVQALALQRLMEEHLYWTMLYARWIDESNWPATKKDFFGKAPFIMRDILATVIRRHMKRELYDQGIGRHTQEEIYKLGIDDLKALNAILSQQEFLLGAEPTSSDAIAYAFIANVIVPPVVSPLKDYVKSQKCFIEYCDRMKARFYG